MSPFTSQKFRFYSFISMLLLVYVHGYNLENTYLQPWGTVSEPLTPTSFFEYFTANGLFRFRIPILFSISGYLFALGDSQPFGIRIKKRARTLLLPYVIWSAVGLLLTFLFQQHPFLLKMVQNAQLDQLGDNRPYREMSWTSLLERLFLVPISFQLWFIRCLFMYNLLYPVLRWLAIQRTAIWFSIAVFLWLTTFGIHFVEGEGLLFFSLGIWMQKRNFNLEQPPRWLLPQRVVIVFLASCIIKTILAFQLHDSVFSFILLSLLHKTAVFAGMVSCWYGADALVKWLMLKSWFQWISGFSFIIYAFHVPLINYASQIAQYYFQDLPGHRILIYLLLPLAIICICVLLGALLRKSVPRVYAILTGGRGL